MWSLPAIFRMYPVYSTSCPPPTHITREWHTYTRTHTTRITRGWHTYTTRTSRTTHTTRITRGWHTYTHACTYAHTQTHTCTRKHTQTRTHANSKQTNKQMRVCRMQLPVGIRSGVSVMPRDSRPFLFFSYL